MTIYQVKFLKIYKDQSYFNIDTVLNKFCLLEIYGRLYVKQ